MNPSTLQRVFLGCILVGFAVPLLQLLFGALGGALDGLFDFDLDLDTETPLPVSLLSLCFTLVVFGVSGLICRQRMGALYGVLLSLAVGLCAGMLLQRFVIRPLKRSRPRAFSIEDLLWTQGTVKLEIRSDFVGTITVLSAIGSQVSYSARLAPWAQGPLKVGDTVVIVEVDKQKSECVVSPVETNTQEQIG